MSVMPTAANTHANAGACAGASGLSSSSSTSTAPDREEAEGRLSPLRKAAILVVSLEEPLAARLLAQLDRPSVEAVTLEMARLEQVETADQHAVLEEFSGLVLRRLRFLFDDVARMDDHDLRVAYHVEDAPVWALALASAPRPVQARVLAALEADSASELRERLAELGPFRLDESEAAQAELAEQLRRLHDHGRITLPDPDGQEEILV